MRPETEDTALLATLLRVGGAPGSLHYCGELLATFGGWRGLLEASPERLQQAEGIGPARAACLGATGHIARRYFESTLPVGQAIRSPSDTEAFLRARLRHLKHELFCGIYLDNRHRVLRFIELFRGTIDGTSVYPREVVREALSLNAAALIVAHNHPSGIAEPSQADERITRRLKAALELVDVRLLDHLVIGDGQAVSLASRGCL